MRLPLRLLAAPVMQIASIGTQISEAFAGLEVAGSSHPRTNATRPRMRLVAEPNGNILLIDDVATSGSHIEEAATLLRRVAAGVTPVAWLADS